MFGRAIRHRREQVGLNQRELGERVGDALGLKKGLTHATISRYESGNRQPDPATLQAIAEAMDTDVDYLRDLDAQLRGKSADVEPSRDEVLRGYVSSKSDVSTWRDKVVRDRGLEDRVHDILMALPLFLDRTSWVVSVNEDHFIEETGRSRQLVDEYLPRAMASKYVERIGRVEYTARLKFPD